MLRDFEAADVDAFVQAFVDDPPLSSSLGHDDAPDRAEALRILEEEPNYRSDGAGMGLAVADRATDAFVGHLVMHSFNWRHERVDLGIFIVRDARGRGLATEALDLACRWAFGRLGLFRAAVATTGDNVAMQRLAERAGFVREGVLRGYTLERGRRVDSHYFSRLADERLERWT